jgi:hypothetical protein
MTYVASPTYPAADPARASNLKQCLDTARMHLDETSKASDTEKEYELIASAVTAGWEEDEVRLSLRGDAAGGAPEAQASREIATFGVVPSSSM